RVDLPGRAAARRRGMSRARALGRLAVVGLAVGAIALTRPLPAVANDGPGAPNRDVDDVIADNARQLIEQGPQIFRYDTFGDEDFWGGQLHLHEAIAGDQHGGVGQGLDPTTALGVGLKVDVDALPRSLRKQLRRGQVDLHDPATTLALLQLDAVVGVTGR